ncbi:MAG: hypothetical protein WCP21_09495, partial [Armatimonadota bacterium]
MDEDTLVDPEQTEELEERERLLFADPNDRPRDGATVIRLRSDRLSLETFAPIFVDLLGLIKADATHLCQQESGILLDNVEHGLAEQVARTLQAQGEDCFTVAAGEIMSLPRPRQVINLQFTKAGLALGNATGEPTQIGWDEVAALAVAHVPIETTQKKTSSNMMMANVGMGFAIGGVGGAVAMAALNPAINTRTIKSSSTHQFLDLASGDGTLHFRIDARQFDYSILGDQLQAGSTANILTLTRWLLTYMPTARTNIDAAQLKEKGTAPLA